MKIYHSLENFAARQPVVTIGTFDGLHKGHQLILDKVKELASEINGETVVFTFYPHPRVITSPNESNLRLLTTKEEKTKLFEKYGIDHLIIYPFSKEFAAMEYSDFVSKILVKQIGTKCLVVGYDHKFGKDRQGSFDYLERCAEKYDFKVERMDALAVDHDNISSTKIRAALQEGDIRKANHYFGHEFTLHGTVVSGKQLGRKLGFPTANIEASDKYKIIPGYGVYAVMVEIGGRQHKGMLNIGTRPTFNKNADNRSIEVNIFDFSEDIYGQKITLNFIDKIRDEQKFSGVDALVQQLQKDQQAAIEILKGN
ncbi:bifunctional riboflavin kinase/FAD synthetase [Maribellus sp. CM-23]|uniref:bifunctional riboflavin kinase/FAD synthetase n=1 Tax=Maribellus sp. CM-23 TaxID=2781026 RepID=UPI001F00AB54|nr:bifunctional riboflavin kinase/FAD synthetase [Maribellus sp. CM-23]MCE4567055.1 bifunctional riboflavin kinase/FAD synthetase [Maribellus sp. CM-23]